MAQLCRLHPPEGPAPGCLLHPRRGEATCCSQALAGAEKGDHSAELVNGNKNRDSGGKKKALILLASANCWGVNTSAVAGLKLQVGRH